MAREFWESESIPRLRRKNGSRGCLELSEKRREKRIKNKKVGKTRSPVKSEAIVDSENFPKDHPGISQSKHRELSPDFCPRRSFAEKGVSQFQRVGGQRENKQKITQPQNENHIPLLSSNYNAGEVKGEADKRAGSQEPSKKRKKERHERLRRTMESKSLPPFPEEIHIWADERGG